YIEHRADNAPSSLDHVGTLEERLVANHAIVQQAFIASRGLRAKVVGVFEIHIHRTKPHHRPRYLGGELQGDAFFRLDVQHELVRHEILDRKSTRLNSSHRTIS